MPNFSIKLTDEEHAVLQKEAQARGLSMKEVLFESIKKGTLADGNRVDEGGTDQMTLEHHGRIQVKGGQLHPDIARILSASNSWLGGFDYEKAAKALAVYYVWTDFNDADIAEFLGYYKRQNMQSERDTEQPEEVMKELNRIAEIFGISPALVKGYYRRVVISGEDKTKATLEE